MALNYVNGLNTSTVDVGNASEQVRSLFWLKNAIIHAVKEQHFSQLANALDMPKHYGKTMKVYEYVPLLDDRNINDQGLDATGAVIADGNLYGSSRDVGTITSRLPALGENGGRVNRVGFARILREGSLNKFGFFYEFSQEALNFDSDEGLREHLARELMNGASQLTEAALQMDLRANAGTMLYTGIATSDATIDATSTLTYADLVRLDQILTDNRTPKQTKIITGSRNIDTRTIPDCRVAFVGSELVPWLKQMTDSFGRPAFIPVHQYAAGATTLNGEIGSIDSFRFVLVPEMLHAAGAGAVYTSGPWRNSGGRYDVHNIMVVGDDAFNTIGFQTDGKTLKFDVMTKMPGMDTASFRDPYGEIGFSSIKWYYGSLIRRPERIAVVKCVAPL